MMQVKSNTILTSINNGVRLIKFNRPEKYNAIDKYMYLEITDILNSDAINSDVVVTILTGNGNYYSSGTDVETDTDSNSEQNSKTKNEIFKDFITAFINYPKLLIAIVNGPAIGVAVTTLALCDVVYASDRATFSTPFVNFGFCPEGCSSYLLPRIMGKSRAMEVLILGRKLTAIEALNCNLISEVVKHKDLNELFKKVEKFGKLPINVVIRSKKLINNNLKDVLHDVNEKETNMLQICVKSEEALEAKKRFMIKKHKL